MVVLKLQEVKRYESLNPHFKAAFDWILSTDFKSLPIGKTEISGSDVFANVQEYETKPESEAFFETHQKYIDIQFLISGCEKIGWAHKNSLEEVEPYNADTDFHKLQGTSEQYVTLEPETACILFPEDGHAPCLNVEDGKKQKVRKICMKIRA